MEETGTERLHFDPPDFRSILRGRFQEWVRRRIPASREVVLGHRNIFIIPTRQGLGFCLILVLMFVGAVNYQASLAFAVVFLLGGLFLLSIFHTYRNLSGLRLAGTAPDAVFAGEMAPVTLVLERRGKRTYEALRLHFPDSPQQVGVDLVASVEERPQLHVPARRRGPFSPGRLTVETTFPFGLCRAWSPIDLAIGGLVWPRPEPCDLQWLLDRVHPSGNRTPVGGNDDFYGLREYQRGDSLKHVAWKNYARGQGLFTKQFSSQVDDKLWLDWDMFPGLGIEARLSRLCWCVLQLSGGLSAYGLRLPGLEIAPGRGDAHYRRVMEALALHGLEQGRAGEGGGE